MRAPLSAIRDICEGVCASETPNCIVDHVATIMEENSPFPTWAHFTLHGDSHLKCAHTLYPWHTRIFMLSFTKISLLTVLSR